MSHALKNRKEYNKVGNPQERGKRDGENDVGRYGRDGDNVRKGWFIQHLQSSAARGVSYDDEEGANRVMMPSKILKQGIVLGMTIFTVLSIVFFRIDSAYSSALTEGHSLQQRIDETPSGGTVKLPAGMYNGPVTLNKPIRIIADGDVQLRSDASVPTIRIQAEGVVLQGLRIVHHGREDTAAVLITANGATLEVWIFKPRLRNRHPGQRSS